LTAFKRSALSSTIGVAVLATASALRAAALSAANLQILTLVDGLSPVYALLLAACLLPPFIFVWKQTGFASPMTAAAHVSTSQLGVAADKDTFAFPTEDGGSEERLLYEYSCFKHNILRFL
jgi:2-methylisocitrate lyase-like PEP mutase family enzyme